jgi:hypothetical protein
MPSKNGVKYNGRRVPTTVPSKNGVRYNGRRDPATVHTDEEVSFDGQQLHVEQQRRVGRNFGRAAALAVAADDHSCRTTSCHEHLPCGVQCAAGMHHTKAPPLVHNRIHSPARLGTLATRWTTSVASMLPLRQLLPRPSPRRALRCNPGCAAARSERRAQIYAGMSAVPVYMWLG